MVHSTDRSKVVVPVSLTFCCFVVYSTRRFVLSLALCYFVFFSPFSIAITSLGEESAFRMFVRFALVWSSSWCLGWATACDCGTPWTVPLILD